MKIDNGNIARVRDFLRELEQLEDALDILTNNDAKVNTEFYTAHTHNAQETKRVDLPLPPDLLNQFQQKIADRVYQIKKELENI